MNDSQATEDFWHVQLPSGEVRFWSLEELDDAFQREEIDGSTYVLKQGETVWQTLSELLGLDEGAAAPAAPLAPAAFATSMTPAPVAMYGADASPLFSAEPLSAAASLRPVAFDTADVSNPYGLDLDDDDMARALAPKRRRMAVMAGAVALGLAVAAVGITRASASSPDKATAVAAASPPAPVAAPIPDKSAEELAAASQPTMSDELKRSLLDADKARAARSAAKAAEKAATNAKYHSATYVSRSSKASQVFHKGGNKFDPLAQ